MTVSEQPVGEEKSEFSKGWTILIAGGLLLFLGQYPESFPEAEDDAPEPTLASPQPETA